MGSLLVWNAHMNTHTCTRLKKHTPKFNFTVTSFLILSVILFFKNWNQHIFSLVLCMSNFLTLKILISSDHYLNRWDQETVACLGRWQMNVKPPPSQRACRRTNYNSAKPKCHILDTSPTKTERPFSLMEKVRTALIHPRIFHWSFSHCFLQIRLDS